MTAKSWFLSGYKQESQRPDSLEALRLVLSFEDELFNRVNQNYDAKSLDPKLMSTFVFFLLLSLVTFCGNDSYII